MRLEADDGRPETSPPLDEAFKWQIVQLHESGMDWDGIRAEVVQIDNHLQQTASERSSPVTSVHTV